MNEDFKQRIFIHFSNTSDAGENNQKFLYRARFTVDSLYSSSHFEPVIVNV